MIWLGNVAFRVMGQHRNPRYTPQVVFIAPNWEPTVIKLVQYCVSA